MVRHLEGKTGRPSRWTEQARQAVDRLDFVARAADIAARTPQPALLVLSGERDFPVLRVDATETGRRAPHALHPPRPRPAHHSAELTHPLAEPPGLHPTPMSLTP